MLTRILVAYDDSPPARRALAEAVCLAQVEGARLIAVAIEEHPPRYDGADASEVRENHEHGLRACHRWLKAARAYASEHGVSITTEVRTGSFFPQLAHAAAGHQADLVVIGRSRHPHLWGRLTATKAERATRRLGYSILIAS